MQSELLEIPKAPVVRGVPRFVERGAYAESFGFQWHQFRRTQLDSFSGLDVSRTRLKRCLGPFFRKLKGARVLEVGCGAGRFTEILLEQGAQVYSVDLSSAVDVNAELFPPSRQHIVIQADLNDLPFRKASFDVVIGLGVLQHTPNPEAAIASLYTQLKSGGALAIDHYRFTLSYVSMRLLYRQILKRLPTDIVLRFLEFLSRWLLPLHERAARTKWLSVLLNRVSPFVTYYSAFPTLTREAQREWALLDSLDSLTDHFKHFRNRRQIAICLHGLGVMVLRLENGGNGVEALAVKP